MGVGVTAGTRGARERGALRAAASARLFGRSVNDMALVAGAGLTAFLLFLLVRTSLTDDAYITLAYAKNLALHLHWGVIPQEVANSATSPLNVVLLGGVSAATRIGGGVHPVLALGIVSVALAMVMAWMWLRIVRALRLPFVVAVLGLALVLANPFLLSAVGLEVLLIPTLLVALVAVALEGRTVWFGAIAGLALLARLDLIIFVLAIAAATPAIRRGWRRTLIATIVVAAPWFLASWIFLGSVVPDTLIIKRGQAGLFGVWSYATGPVMYYTSRPNAVLIAFLPAVIGLFVLVGWFVVRTAVRWASADGFPSLGPVAGLGAGAVAYYGVYSVLGVGPYHWYYVPPSVALSAFLVIAAGVWLTAARRRPRLRAGAPGLVLGLAGLLAVGNFAVDAGKGVPWKSPVIFGNWASAKDYARVGAELRKRVGNATVSAPGEIGTLAYFCDCALVDEFSDRGVVVADINRRISHAGLVKRAIYRLNYLWLDRSQKPRRVDYRLRYGRGPATGPDSWQVWSAAKGVGHFTLLRGPDPAPR